MIRATVLVVELTFRRPTPVLVPFVDLFWYASAPPQEIARERVLPTGRAELIVDLAEDHTRVFDGATGDRARVFAPVILCGPHSRAFAINTDVPTRVVGVHFRAGGARPFFDPPLDLLGDDHFALEDLWSRSLADELRSRLGEAPTPELALEALETWLLARAVRPLVLHPAVAATLSMLRATPDVTRIDAMAATVGISPGRLRALFHREVGLAPNVSRASAASSECSARSSTSARSTGPMSPRVAGTSTRAI